jgi:YXWGXW repeat-containing protein
MRIARWIVLAAIAMAVLMIPAPSRAQVAVGISVGFAPPDLPVYEQPPCPGEGYVWTPGYWAYDANDGYYWVPGTWVLAPVGLLWTPGYWGWQNSVYVWYPGYWGPVVGFYGGINYGYGYVGTGYEGGYWNHGAFYYNRSVNNVHNVTNVYNKTVINNVTVNNVSFNGGQGGTNARPTAAQEAAARTPHTEPVAAQVRHEQEARTNRSQFASVNHGKPGVAATERPAEFTSKGAVSAKAAAPYNPPPAKSANRPGQPNRPANPPAASRPEPSNPRQPATRPENPGRNENPQPETRQPQNQPRTQQQPAQRQEQPRAQAPREQPNERPAQPPPQNERRMNPPEQPRPQERPKAQPRQEGKPPQHQQEQRPQQDENRK